MMSLSSLVATLNFLLASDTGCWVDGGSGSGSATAAWMGAGISLMCLRHNSSNPTFGSSGGSKPASWSSSFWASEALSYSPLRVSFCSCQWGRPRDLLPLDFARSWQTWRPGELGSYKARLAYGCLCFKRKHSPHLAQGLKNRFPHPIRCLMCYCTLRLPNLLCHKRRRRPCPSIVPLITVPCTGTGHIPRVSTMPAFRVPFHLVFGDPSHSALLACDYFGRHDGENLTRPNRKGTIRVRNSTQRNGLL